MGILGKLCRRKSTEDSDDPPTYEERTHKTYEDIETQTRTLGLVSVLVLTIAIGLQHQVSPQAHHYSDFRGLICTSSAFRTYIIEVLEWRDDNRTYNESIPLGAGKWLNIRYELETGIVARLSDAEDVDAGDNVSRNFSDRNVTEPYVEPRRCFKDSMVQAAVEVVYQQFPAHYLNVWYSQNPDVYRYSDHVERCGAIAAAMTFSSLLWSILLYNSLSLSSAREDLTGKCLQRWLKLGRPTITFSYLVLIGGLFMFFISHVHFKTTQSPFYALSEFNVSTIALLYVVTPMSALGGFLAIVITIYSGRGKQPPPDEPTASRPRTSESAGYHPGQFRHDI